LLTCAASLQLYVDVLWFLDRQGAARAVALDVYQCCTGKLAITAAAEFSVPPFSASSMLKITAVRCASGTVEAF
jgi:hypothetical protein